MSQFFFRKFCRARKFFKKVPSGKRSNDLWMPTTPTATARFCRALVLGMTDFAEKDIGDIVELFGRDYTGRAYHLVRRNCNVFCNDLSIFLTGNPIPEWVNRPAYIAGVGAWASGEGNRNVSTSKSRQKSQLKYFKKEKFTLRLALEIAALFSLHFEVAKSKFVISLNVDEKVARFLRQIARFWPLCDFPALPFPSACRCGRSASPGSGTPRTPWSGC